MTYPQAPQGPQNPEGQPIPEGQQIPQGPHNLEAPQGPLPQFQPYPAIPVQYQLRPSGGTAVTAGVLACLGAFWAIISALINFSSVNDVPDNAAWIIWLQGIAMVIELITLLPGAILLFMRKTNGRLLVAVGSVVHILQGVIAAIGLLSLSQVSSRFSGASAVGQGTAGLLIALAPAIATLILVLVPATRRWCEAGNQSVPQQQYPGSSF